MAAQNTDALVAMSREEVERTMRTLEPMYDLVRLVDPSTMEGASLDERGELAMPHRCFDVLCKGRRCQNCISARTVGSKGSVSKFEFVGDDAFYISTRYVEVDGEPRSIELVKKIGDQVVIDPSLGEGVASVRRAMEYDSQHRYRDEASGALRRAYLDEGISAIRGEKLALVCVEGPSDDAIRGLLPELVQVMERRLRVQDTIVRFEDEPGGTFVLLFEGITRGVFGELLDGVRSDLCAVLEERLDDPAFEVSIGGVAREGLVGELLELAREAQAQARESARHVALLIQAGDEEDTSARELGEVPSTGGHAAVDALTGLLTTSAFHAILSERIETRVEGDPSFCIAHFDIENFKLYNRAFGIAEGDVLLARFADELRVLFPTEPLARTGIDTFEVIAESDGLEGRIAELRGRLHGLRRGVALQLKCGVCAIGDDTRSAHTAMDQAKTACESVKGTYSRFVRWFDRELEHEVGMDTYLVESLDTALEKGYIQPYYQAIVRAFTGKVCACEVLSRWVDPERGLISPVEIIPSLERRHLIHRHDIHIVRCACRDLRHRMDQGRRVVPVSVNLSRLDFELCDIFQEVEDALAAHGIPRSLVGIEVTESALSGTEEGFRREMERFRGAGYEIWMDDFGSGYSSLNTLKDYTFDVLKIDMDFMRGLEGNRNSRRIVRSVVDMAKRIGVRTLAEGVETREQFDYLRSLGCEMIQGFLFARPMPLDDLDLTQYVGIEDDMERAYLDQVGRVNLLSQTPGEELTSSREQRTKGRPFAIVSWNGRELSYFSANDAYERLLRERGIGSIEEAQARLDEDWDLLAEIGALDTSNDYALERSSLRFILGDALHPARLSVVARQRGSVAILVSPQG